MALQYFILGRNPKLSYAEISAYNEARGNLKKEIFFEENYLLLDVKSEININELGGVIKSGLIESHGREDEVEGYVISNELIPEDKFTYAVFGNCDDEILKFKFKSEKRKAILKHGRTRLKFQDGQKINLPKADHYLILHEYDNMFYFGIVNQEYDMMSVEHRDMSKPVRREELAISPRLSKILINLSGVKEGDLLLDPFCGVGGIIQESLLKNIPAYGVDKDPKAIYAARKNLQWLKATYKTKTMFTVEAKDARHTPDKKFDGVATETPLGEILKKQLNERRSEEFVRRFERLIIPILKQLKRVKKKSAKIAITFPVLKRAKVDMEKVVEETGLALVSEPILESKAKQIVSREIVVFR